jgi:hypothetical protein
MNKIMGKALALVGFMAPVITLAQDYDYNYNVNWDYDYDYGTTSEVAGAGAAALGIGMMLFIGFMCLIGLAFFIFWLVMLIDCVKRQFEQRNTWLLVLIISVFLGFSWLAAILYYFMVKRKNLGTKPTAPVQK